MMMCFFCYHISYLITKMFRARDRESRLLHSSYMGVIQVSGSQPLAMLQRGKKIKLTLHFFWVGARWVLVRGHLFSVLLGQYFVLGFFLLLVGGCFGVGFLGFALILVYF